MFFRHRCHHHLGNKRNKDVAGSHLALLGVRMRGWQHNAVLDDPYAHNPGRPQLLWRCLEYVLLHVIIAAGGCSCYRGWRRHRLDCTTGVAAV